MRFVDKLNAMPAQEDIIAKARKQKFDKTVNNIHGEIKASSIKHRSERRASGYILVYSDHEYNYEWCEAHDTLYWPYERRDTKTNPNCWEKGSKWSVLMLSRSDRSEGEALGKSVEECEGYRRALLPLLKEDGFRSIRLTVKPVYQAYDVVREKLGLLKNTYWLERVETKELLGYTIYFEITW